MKFSYYPETDSLYIELSDNPGADAQEISPGVVLDFDAEGKLVGIDIEYASKVTNLSSLKIEGLSMSSLSLIK